MTESVINYIVPAAGFTSADVHKLTGGGAMQIQYRRETLDGAPFIPSGIIMMGDVSASCSEIGLTLSFSGSIFSFPYPGVFTQTWEIDGTGVVIFVDYPIMPFERL